MTNLKYDLDFKTLVLAHTEKTLLKDAIDGATYLLLLDQVERLKKDIREIIAQLPMSPSDQKFLSKVSKKYAKSKKKKKSRR